MELILYLIVIAAFGFFLYKLGNRKEDELTDQYMNGIHLDMMKDDDKGQSQQSTQPASDQPMHFDLLDENAIKILAHDGHRVGYVPKDQTKYVRDFTSLPCPCYCYIGCNEDHYFSCCYINN